MRYSNFLVPVLLGTAHRYSRHSQLLSVYENGPDNKRSTEPSPVELARSREVTGIRMGRLVAAGQCVLIYRGSGLRGWESTGQRAGMAWGELWVLGRGLHLGHWANISEWFLASGLSTEMISPFPQLTEKERKLLPTCSSTMEYCKGKPDNVG